MRRFLYGFSKAARRWPPRDVQHGGCIFPVSGPSHPVLASQVPAQFLKNSACGMSPLSCLPSLYLQNRCVFPTWLLHAGYIRKGVLKAHCGPSNRRRKLERERSFSSSLLPPTYRDCFLLGAEGEPGSTRPSAQRFHPSRGGRMGRG